MVNKIIVDAHVLHGLVKRWLQDLKDDMEEPLQARFMFKRNLVGSVNQISCNLTISINQIADGFSPCQVLKMSGIFVYILTFFVFIEPCLVQFLRR